MPLLPLHWLVFVSFLLYFPSCLLCFSAIHFPLYHENFVQIQRIKAEALFVVFANSHPTHFVHLTYPHPDGSQRRSGECPLPPATSLGLTVLFEATPSSKSFPVGSKASKSSLPPTSEGLSWHQVWARALGFVKKSMVSTVMEGG